MIAEGQRHHSGKILDRADLFEDLGEAGHLGDLGVPCGDLCRDLRLPILTTEEPVEAGLLQGE